MARFRAELLGLDIEVFGPHERYADRASEYIILAEISGQSLERDREGARGEEGQTLDGIVISHFPVILYLLFTSFGSAG